jgi:WD40 repeat protein
MNSIASAQQPVDYATQVAPVLKTHCASCHNDEESEGDFNVSSVATMLDGSSAGPAFERGKGAESHIVKLMRGTEDPAMPPEDEFDRVPDEEIAIIERWINEGAKASEAMGTLAIQTPDWKAKTKVNPSVLAADWSPDGRQIAIAQFGKVQLLDAETMKPVHVFDSLSGKVNSVQFSSNGKRLIAASGISGVGGQAIIWDADSKEIVSELNGHGDVMYDAVISHDGKMAATSAYDKSILLWDIASGKQLRKLKGHNSAIYDLDFSLDSKNLISASGDQTIKVWNVSTGQRLDTLGQPLKEQFTTVFSPDGKLVVGGGRDNRLRVWKLASIDSPQINPILFSRFAHEASIVRLEFSMDGSKLFSSSEDRMIKVWETKSFLQVGMIDQQPAICSAIAVSPDGSQIFLGRLDGSMEVVGVPTATNAVAAAQPVQVLEKHRKNTSETKTITETEPNDSPSEAQVVSLPAEVKGNIAANSSGGSDVDLFRFTVEAGQSLMVETKAARDKSPVDTRIEILYAKDGAPVPQVLLRAVRDSYFTFRGKDSDTFDDFRVHNWEEMKLNEFIYAGGEVNKLFLHPRGPDSGFRVYPGAGKRFGYFGTTAMSHALHEPCYIVEPWPPGTTFLPNGLPVFEINYENDDDSRREFGNDSRLKFVAPADGDYLVRVTDVRGFGGDDFNYSLTVRESNPDFEIKIKGLKNVFPSSGAEFQVVAERKDGYEGEIQVEVKNLPDGFHATSPLTIESGHVEAVGAIYALEGAKTLTEEQAKAISIESTAEIAGESVSKTSQGVSVVTVEEKEPKVSFAIIAGPDDPLPEERDFEKPLVLEIRPGESTMAYIVAKRNGHKGPIKFGNEGSGRNLPHGVKVDDIGLNGLMIPAGQLRQRFFIKAEEFVKPQSRMFHLKVDNVDKLVCPPVVLKVVGAEANDE